MRCYNWSSITGNACIVLACAFQNRASFFLQVLSKVLRLKHSYEGRSCILLSGDSQYTLSINCPGPQAHILPVMYQALSAWDCNYILHLTEYSYQWLQNLLSSFAHDP